ncbi:MAG: glycosyltransferase [Gemmatimonadales bacterium]
MIAREPETPATHLSDTPERSAAEQRAFFAAAMDRAAQSESRTGDVRVQLDLAGTRVELIFAGDALVAPLTAALAHLIASGTGTPDATIHVWDTTSTGVEIVPPLWTRTCYTDRGDIWGMTHPRLRSAFHWLEFSLNLLDLDRRTGMFWVRSAEQLPYWTLSSPFRTLFHWWLEETGAQLLHAAAVGTDDGALLITGKGGVGKSTTALACLASGMRYVGDDYLAVRLEPEPVAYSLYSTAKLEPAQVERFPALRALITNGGPLDEKAVIQLVPAFARQVSRSLPLRAIATLSFGDSDDTTVTPASCSMLRGAASFTTLSQLPHAGQRTHQFIHRMVERLPGLRLILGRDVSTVPTVIRALLERDDASLARLADDRTQAVPARPLLSVIIPVYNGASFLPHAVASVLAQEYPALEIIVVDDGSTDEIADVVRRLPVDVRYFRQDNTGASSARNRGIRDASGEFIAFLDVDDLWPSGMLTNLVTRLEESPETDLVHGRGQVTRFTGFAEPGDYVGSPAESFPFYIGAGVYRRRAFERVGLFDLDLRFCEDADWFARARERQARVQRIDDITLLVRRHDGNMTRGKSHADMGVLRLFKKAIDRQRQQPG